MEKNTLTPKKPQNDRRPKKFMPNNQYFTISIYVLIVITCAVLIARVIMTPHAVTNGLRSVFSVLMPFILGVLIAFMLNPVIKHLSSLLHRFCHVRSGKLCKLLSMLIAYFLVIGLLLVCLIFIVPQIINSITELINGLPKLYQTSYQFFAKLQERFPNTDVSAIQKAVNNALPDVISTLRQFASNLVPALYTFSVSLLNALLNLVIAIIVSVYMLVDKKLLKHHLKLIIYSIVPEQFIDTIIMILRECNRLFTSFIVGKSIDSLIIGLLCFILMSIFRMEYALLISVIVGVTNMIPYFGPFIGAVPGVLVLLMVSPVKALGFLFLIFILQQFDGLFLGPKIMGDSVGVKPLWIIISITLGGSLAGVLGMFLSVPTAAILGYLMNLFLKYRLKKRNINPDVL
ncbi:MAG: AI-2E family transporter [Eubacteriales bacterium]|nr:AI-2E family transporter [Eubacteriales bacterium]